MQGLLCFLEIIQYFILQKKTVMSQILLGETQAG
jgi:hypothetical protein